jgi:putative protease
MHRPEILAPAGTEDALKAALAAGADAVYFGLDEGFNARARATNFPVGGLPDTVARIHRAGAKAYVTMNTLVFEPELPAAEAMLRAIAAAGVDAIIVQDPAIALLARAICPALEVHASTQMTIGSPAAAAFAAELGANRVVVPRELSLDEIRKFAASTPMELEVFVHGALCMSWSGQCLTSEAWGGRSANRGQCAQSCRLPYELVVDGKVVPLGEIAYLLSPRDLAGADVVPELAEIGVASLKIEGRQKSPAYVGTAVGAYRRRVDDLEQPTSAADMQAMTLAYSRGFSTGFFRGSDHQTLVDGRFPKHRGVFLGTVLGVRGDEVDVSADAPSTTLGSASLRASGLPFELRPGQGVVFDAGNPEDKREPGGPLFRVARLPDRWRLGFGRPGPDLTRVTPGQRVWVTSDPAIARAVEKASEREPEGRVPVAMIARGARGEPLVVVAIAGSARAEAVSDELLGEARNAGLDDALLADKLGAMGGTPFRMESLDRAGLPDGLHLSPGALKRVRRAIVEALVPAVERGPERILAAPGAVGRVRAALPVVPAAQDAAPQLVPLCRTDAQLDAAIASGLAEVELDWMELIGLRKAVERARAAGLRVTVATLRVTKPGEDAFDEQIARLEPDAILVRHWAALERFRGRGIPLHGDFSLNVTNSLTGRFVLGRGLATVTASFDLDEAQLDALIGAMPADRVTVMTYHRIPTFHTEHCTYAAHLSDGKDFRTCGRPCESHALSLKDEQGRELPVIVDAGCRNTVFNHKVQSAASLVPGLITRGVRRFRVEFVRETRGEATAVIEAHLALLAGKMKPAELVAKFGVAAQFGVGEGRMATVAE